MVADAFPLMNPVLYNQETTLDSASDIASIKNSLQQLLNSAAVGDIRIVGPAGSHQADFFTLGVNDNIVIQQAIDDLPSGGGKVLLLSGTYDITAPIRITQNNVVLQGLGTGSKLVLANNVNDAVIKIGNKVNTFVNIVIDNLYIDGNGKQQTSHGTPDTNSCIVIRNFCDLVYINRCHIIRPFTHCVNASSDVLLTGIGHVSITNCYMDGTDAVHFADSGDQFFLDVVALESKYNLIDSCFFVNTTRGGFYSPYVEVFGDDGFTTVDNTTIVTNNIFQGVGISTQRANLVAANNFLSNLPGGGASQIAVTSTSTGTASASITGNIIYSNQSDSVNAGIAVEGQNISIVGNCIWLDNTAQDYSAGIILDNRTANTFTEVSGNTIILNVDGVTTTYMDGILLNGSDNNGTISGNVIKSVNQANGSTIDSTAINASGLGLNSGNSILITGNTIYQAGRAISGGSNITGNFVIDCVNGITSSATITGNYLRGVGFLSNIAIEPQAFSNNMTISGNTIFDWGQEGIKLNASNYCTVSNNNITDVGQTTNNIYSGILISGTSTYNTFEGNTIVTRSASNLHKYGIREDTSGDGPNIITGNVCLNAVTAQISTQNASTDVSHNLTT